MSCIKPNTRMHCLSFPDLHNWLLRSIDSRVKSCFQTYWLSFYVFKYWLSIQVFKHWLSLFMFIQIFLNLCLLGGENPSKNKGCTCFTEHYHSIAFFRNSISFSSFCISLNLHFLSSTSASTSTLAFFQYQLIMFKV